MRAVIRGGDMGSGRRIQWVATFAAIVALAGTDTAIAQAYKCKDAKGRITYSDAPCLGQDTSTVSTSGNTVDGSADRGRASRSEETSSGSRGSQASSGMTEQQRQDRIRELEIDSKRVGNTPQQRRAAKKELEELMGGGPAKEASASGQSARKPSSAETLPSSSGPAIVVNCDPAGCWDTQGRRYNKGAGPTFIRSDGRPCQQVGNQFQCN